MLTQHRSFVDEMDRESDGFFVADEDFPIIPGDQGSAYRSKEEIAKRTPASIEQKKKKLQLGSLKMELAVKERELRESSQEGYKVYTSYESNFSSDSQKLYYLSLNPVEKRNFLYSLDKQGLAKDSGTGELGRSPAGGVSSHILNVGMSKRDVVRKWGKPLNVAIAGNVEFQNERWSYVNEGKASSIYFERGVVQGWELP